MVLSSVSIIGNLKGLKIVSLVTQPILLNFCSIIVGQWNLGDLITNQADGKN